MGWTKERKKLEKLSEKITPLQNYDGQNLTIITDIFEQYSHTVRILKNKATDIFNDLYLNELQEVKLCKKTLKDGQEEDRQLNFTNYKETLSAALIKTIQVIKSTA